MGALLWSCLCGKILGSHEDPASEEFLCRLISNVPSYASNAFFEAVLLFRSIVMSRTVIC